jgi:tRNA nucleotidyltransferase (CCA-adding enzyme)
MSRTLVRPRPEGIPEPLRSAVREIAERLASAGARAWVVGGAVRDLALGRAPKDADVASPALPEVVERSFEQTVAVGKHFGTIVVRAAGVDVQVTTFRREGPYSDGRRPDDVLFGTNLEEDARRRDFTCNALYLDPLTGEFRDPAGGFEDLVRGRLRCVGDPGRRFAEDGLRLLRLARFAAALDLEVEPATLEAARQSAGKLAGVSPERILLELDALSNGPDPARALGLLADIGVLPGVLALPAEDVEEGLRAVARLGAAPGLALLLAVLLGPLAERDRERALACVASRRPSRELVRTLGLVWDGCAELDAVLAAGERAPRAARIRLVREPEWPLVLAAHRARHPGAARTPEDVPERARAELEAFARSLPRDELFPRPWLTSADLERAGVPRGPQWGMLLEEAEEARLAGAHASREDALRWLGERASRPT